MFAPLARSDPAAWGDLLYPLFAERCGVHVHRAVDTIAFGNLAARTCPRAAPARRAPVRAGAAPGVRSGRPMRGVAHHAGGRQRIPLHRLHHLRCIHGRLHPESSGHIAFAFGHSLSTVSLSRRSILAAGAAALALPAGRSFAAGEIAGGKPITLLVSYPAGGGADVMARLIAPRMAEALGQPVVVENKPGASGTIAAGQVARATPDGSRVAARRLVVRGEPVAVRQAALRHGHRLCAAGGAGHLPQRAGVHTGFRGALPGRCAAPGARQAGQAGLCLVGQWLGTAPGRRVVRGHGQGGDVAHSLPRRRPGTQRCDGRAGAAVLCQRGLVAGAHPVGAGCGRWRSRRGCVRVCCPSCRPWTRLGSRATRCSSGTRCSPRPACRRQCARRWPPPSTGRWPIPNCWAACVRWVARCLAVPRPRRPRF